jgi:deoxyadenosine/deoxycytidine kinase
LLKNARAKDGSILADFSIEKDLVFARMNLTTKQYYVFKQVYDYVVENVGLSDLVIFLDPPFEISSQNIANRGRPNEVNINLLYFKNYADHIKSYFVHESKTKVLMMDNSDLELDSRNEKVREITDAINVMM